jgi:ribonuclease G
MGKEIVINTEQNQTRIAILEGGQLAELYYENPDNARTLGDICLARVRKVMPSIKAAFVDIGHKQDAFLHFSDLSDNVDDLISFLAMDKPAVAGVTLTSEVPRSRGKRRHPRTVKGHDAATEEEDSERPTEKDSRERAEARKGRRSAQRRGKGDRPEEEGSETEAEMEDDDRPEERADPEKLARFLKRDQKILVKIVKEPISNKGSRVSTDISLAGRFLVLVPLANYVAVSKKISSYKERRRLRALAKSLLPDGFGVIVRTVAEDKNAKALYGDLQLLLEKWNRIEKKLQETPEPPATLHEDVNMVSSVMRDLFSEDYDRILMDDPRVYRNIKNYVQAIAPQMVPAVQLHKGKEPIFKVAGIDKDVTQSFESRVDLPSGGYLFIERTEAMFVVDVNSGRSGRGMSQEENSLRVNLEAARVIARQLRLRDIGGIIVVDFIDLREDRNRKKVYDEIKKEFRKDRAVTKLLPMSDFGLIEITRQRLRPSYTTTFDAPPGPGVSAAEPTAKVNGTVGGGRERPQEKSAQPENVSQQESESADAGGGSRRNRRRDDRPRLTPEDLVEKIEKWIAAYREEGKRQPVILRVHPFTAAFLTRKVPSHPTRWFMRYLVRVRLETDADMPPLAFRFIDPRTGEVIRKQREERDGGGRNQGRGKDRDKGAEAKSELTSA